MEEVYAKVVNGQIVEYPVYLVHIKTRGHDVKDYVRVVDRKQPIVDFYHIAVPRMYFEPSGNFVIIEYDIVEKSAAQIEQDLEKEKRVRIQVLKKNLLNFLNASSNETPAIFEEVPESFTFISRNKPKLSSTVLNIDVDFSYSALYNVQCIINTLSNPESTILFRTYDNSFILVEKEQLQALKQEMEAKIVSLIQQKFEREALIKSAQTYEQLLSIPLTFN
jgi:hypothetical protein